MNGPKLDQPPLPSVNINGIRVTKTTQAWFSLSFSPHWLSINDPNFLIPHIYIHFYQTSCKHHFCSSLQQAAAVSFGQSLCSCLQGVSALPQAKVESYPAHMDCTCRKHLIRDSSIRVRRVCTKVCLCQTEWVKKKLFYSHWRTFYSL